MNSDRTPSLNRSVPRYYYGAIALILLVAAALRLWGLPGIPPGPHYDEAADGILASEIAQGLERPIFIPAYTGKEVLFFYLAAAAMRLIGIGLLAQRLTAALTGLLTVAVTAWLVYELFVDDHPVGARWLAALTAALLATSFWHVLLSRLGFRSITQPLLQALTLAALWRGLRQGDRPDTTRSARAWLLLGGLFCGLTGYTYLAARAFPFPLAIGLVALLIVDRHHWRQRLIQIALFGLGALASFAPLGLYFLRHPDQFANRMRQVGPGGDWSAALNGIVASLKMLFLRGDPYIRFNLPFRPLFGPFIGFFLLLGLAVTLWRLFQPQTTGASRARARAREVLLLIWIPMMLLPTGLAVNEVTPSNLRAIGLIPLIFLLPARGLWTLLKLPDRASRITPYLPLVATCAVLLTTGLITARAYFDEYAPRTDLYEASDGDLADIAAYLNKADLSATTVYVGSIHYRHPTLAFLAKAYAQIKWLVGASTVVYPASGEALYLFPRSATPAATWLARYLPDATPVEASIAPDGAPAFTAYRLSSPSRLSDEVAANFAGGARLLSYQIEQAVSGAEVEATVVWQVLAPPPYPDLIPFYHLEDAWGFRWGQAEPFHYAAEGWTPGEIVVDRVQVPVGPGAPPGDYLLRAGLYSRSADVRLSVVDSAGRFAGTTAPLTVHVARAETPPGLDRLGIRERLDLGAGTGLTLLGFNLDTTQVRPGEQIDLTLFWQADPDPTGNGSPSRPDHAVVLALQDSQDIPLYRGAPVRGTYPTGQWEDGEIVVDHTNPRLPLAAAEAPPGDYALELTLTAPDGQLIAGPAVLGTLTLVPTARSFDVPAMHYTQPVALGDQIELLGYDLELADARPGGTLHLVLYWRALAEMEASYTVFTHLLGPDGQTAAQQDNPPVNGTYPTPLWLPGEVVTDPYAIALPADLAPGDYPIEVGLYIAENGLRPAEPVRLGTLIAVRP